MLNWPPDMWRMVAALFMIWSSASRLKLQVITSTIGRIPPSAAPIPDDAPVTPPGETPAPAATETSVDVNDDAVDDADPRVALASRSAVAARTSRPSARRRWRAIAPLATKVVKPEA